MVSRCLYGLHLNLSYVHASFVLPFLCLRATQMEVANSTCFCGYWRSFSIFLFTFRAVHLSRICSSTLTHALCFLGAQFRFMPHVSHIRDSACWLHVHQLAFVFVFNRTYAWVVIMQSAFIIIACMNSAAPIVLSEWELFISRPYWSFSYHLKRPCLLHIILRALLCVLLRHCWFFYC